MRIRERRAPLALGVAAALLVPLGVAAQAVVVAPATPRTGTLVQVGPIAGTGYPAWYRDSNGIRLEGCWTLDDPLCPALPDTVPNPDAPASYPDNFPVEHFYQLAAASVAAGQAGTVDIGMDLEGAWVNEAVVDGDQMVFGRIRIRAKDAADGEYRVTHPYGVDEFVATGGTGINMTEDIGTTPGAFGQVLQSRVGPYLTWDTFALNDPTPGGPGEPPAGYVGDPGVEHTVTGSPYGTNFVRVERKAADGSWATVGSTDLFTVQGRLSRNDGVDVQQATYRTTDDGTTVVEVFASSEAGEAITMVAPELGYKRIGLAEDSVTVQTGATSSHQVGRYYGRYAVKAGVPVTGGTDATRIVVQNAGDVPVTSKTVRLTDVVTVGAATYDGTGLRVEATSSDSAADLTVAGFGPVTGGVGTFGGVAAPPHQVTVTSSEGGTVTVPLTTSGPFTAPDPPVAVVTATPLRPIAGQPVTLDATGSLDATSVEWAVLSTPTGAEPFTLSGAKPSFTPTRSGRYEVSVVAVGDSGRSVPSTIAVDVVSGTQTVTARAGANQTVRRGAGVTLDGSASVGAVSYAWQQVPNTAGGTLPADQVVALSDPKSARPTFTLPAMALPTAPGPNPGYTTAGTTPLRFQLSVTGVDGTTTSTATTVVRPQAETLAGITARYRTRGEWRVSGTTDVLAGQKVAVVLGSRLNAAGTPTATSARGRVIGTATVDAAGAWSYVGTGPDPRAAATSATTVTIVSAAGGQVVAPITVTG